MKPADDRFWAHVRPGPTPADPALAGACQLWTGPRTKHGQGRFRLSHKVEVRAHRYAWTLAHGPIPPGLVLIRRCETAACVEPSHYAVGDCVDRQLADLDGDGVKRRGRLTPEQIRVLRASYLLSDATQRQLAAQFGISQASVSMITRRRTWRYV